MERLIRKKRNLILFLGLIILSICVLFFVLNYFLKYPSFEEVMREPTKLLNKKSMTMIDKETRFDSGIVLPKRVFQYNATLINQDSSSLNIEGFKKDALQVLLKRVKIDSDLQILRDNKATISYRFRDKNGKILFDAFFTPQQYLK